MNLADTRAPQPDSPSPRRAGPGPFDETFALRWGRRALTIPLYLMLASLSLALLPLTVGLALIVDGIRRTGCWATTRATLAMTLYFACEGFGLIVSFLIW